MKLLEKIKDFKKIDYIEYNNNLIDNKEVSSHIADEKDIIYLVGNLYCLCEPNGNIIVFSKTTDIKNVKNIVIFIYILYKFHNIDYIIISSIKDKWLPLLRNFTFLKDNDIKDRDLYALKISDNLNRFRHFICNFS